MSQNNTRSTFASLIVVFVLLVVSSACGEATEAEFNEWSDEFSATTDETSSTDKPSAPRTDAEPTDPGTSAEQAPSEQDPAATAQAAAAPANPTAFLGESDTRAMWMWSESPGVAKLMNNAGGAQDELFEFLSAPQGQPDRAINRLLFEARGYSNVDRFSKLRQTTYDPIRKGGKQKRLRSFLKRAKSQGIAVEYLDGQAIWVATDENAEQPKQSCRDIVAFNQGTDDPMERFDGVHLDIEPHTVRDGPFAGKWWENKLDGGYNAEWTARWKDILNSCRSTLDAYEAETGHHMTLASDLGTDYAFYNKPMLDFLNRKDGPLDYMTIMNYFDNRPNKDGDPSYFYGDGEDGNEPIGGVIENLAEWSQLPLMFAVETGPESIAADWQSFNQEGYGAMYRTIDQLLKDYNSSKMIGVGIHHYGPKSFKGMKP
jgi:hypothetical protein